MDRIVDTSFLQKHLVNNDLNLSSTTENERELENQLILEEKISNNYFKLSIFFYFVAITYSFFLIFADFEIFKIRHKNFKKEHNQEYLAFSLHTINLDYIESDHKDEISNPLSCVENKEINCLDTCKDITDDYIMTRYEISCNKMFKYYVSGLIVFFYVKKVYLWGFF
jgi:hypothetical protein